MEHIVRMSCLFCFVFDLLDTLTRRNDLVPDQSYPLTLIGLECFCEFSRVSFNNFVLHSVIVCIGLPYQKPLSTATPVSIYSICLPYFSYFEQRSFCERSPFNFGKSTKMCSDTKESHIDNISTQIALYIDAF